MPAPEGNKYWLQRSSHGRRPIFESPEQLYDACCEYFEHAQSNPIRLSDDKSLVRPFTIEGLIVFLGITRSTWVNYCQSEDFLAVTEEINLIIRDQKFSGAAVGVFKENIIARDLGLADKQQNELGNLNGQAFKTDNKYEVIFHDADRKTAE